MRMLRISVAAVATAILASAYPALAQLKTDLGKREFDSKCAVCHGVAGRGDGPYAGIIDTRIADLGTLARRNGGVFPFARVYELIDGTQGVKAHGTRDMPIWGREYRMQAGEWFGDAPYDPEAFARARSRALTAYVYRPPAT
jgi:hypothetical protein